MSTRILTMILAILSTLSPALAGSRIGDAGHFFIHLPDVWVNNPEGKVFQVTVHRHVWPADWGNNGTYSVRVLAPDGACVASNAIAISNEHVTVDVPAGAKGVYRLDIKPGGYGLTWVESSLDQIVIGTGDYDLKDSPFHTFDLHVMVPRRWYFYVPAGTRGFQVKHTVQPFQSHREDYGFLVMSPRGQRMNAWYGGKPLDVETRSPNSPIAVERTVEVDEGAAGHFWSIWATGGDSHNFSDLQIQLKGVPNVLAPTPEQWFDPSTGLPPPAFAYDDSPIRLRDQKNAKGEPVSRDHYLWTPTPYLGDEDYNGWRGPQTVLLLNPTNRPFDLGIVTYIADDKARFPVHVRVIDPKGNGLLETDGQFGHHFSYRASVPAAGPGVYRAEITAGRWFPWIEPVMPFMIEGKKTPDGAARFELETGIARHWFFKVPAGLKRFRAAASVKDPNHVLSLEIHAPDRLMDLAYVRGGQKREFAIDVPDGLDNHIWFVRVDVGSPTRFVSGDNAPRHVTIEADLDLYDVPGVLAPTWEQWFAPR